MPLSTLTNPVVCKHCNKERFRFISSENEKCTSCYKKEYYKKNTEKIKEQNNNWKLKNIDKSREIQRNNREKKRIINHCPNCNRICHKTKHFIEVNMCRGCFEVKEKERKYNEKILRKTKKQPKQITKEKTDEYYRNYYYKNRESILEKKRSKLFLLKKEDQDEFEFYLQKEREDFKIIWDKHGKPVEDIQVKVYRDLKKNKVFKKINTSKRRIRYSTSATLGKNLLVKNGKSFDWTIVKDMISFQEQLKIYGLENSSLFNPAVEEIIKQKAAKDKEIKRLASKKYRRENPEKVKDSSKKWLLNIKENVGYEVYKRKQNENQKKYYSKTMVENPEKLRESAKRYYLKNRKKILNIQKQSYANRKKMPKMQTE